MILYLAADAQPADIDALCDNLRFMGFEPRYEGNGARRCIILVSGVNEQTHVEAFVDLPFICEVSPLKERFKLASKAVKSQSIIELGDLKIGGGDFVVMAGPCSIESEKQLHVIAEKVSTSGAHLLRGGAFKPRTSPYEFQGLGEEGLKYMRQAADDNGLFCVSEIMGIEDIDLLEQYVDVLQVGSRNMHNFSLLKALGRTKKTILLKRGLSATYKEFISAAEYIISHGNEQVMLCERGIRTFETYSRNTLDLAAVPILKSLTHLPVIVDPSHGVGLRIAVPALAKAAMAVGADGLMVEVHTHPDQSVSDAAQTIAPETFDALMGDLRQLAPVCGRVLPKVGVIA